MWPLAPSTKVTSPDNNFMLPKAVRHGTMWSSCEAYAYTGQSIFDKSIGTPHNVTFPGTRRLFSRYVLRTYQQNIGPDKLVLSAFQYKRSNAVGGLPIK